MYSVWKLISRPKCLLSASHVVLKIFKETKCSQLKISKFSGTVGNSGCLIAGCCFSRQSDEETLISNRQNNISVNVDVPIVETVDCLYSHLETPSYLVNMKRTAEYVNENILPDVSLANNSDQTFKPLYKKSKTVESSIQDESTEQEFCKNKNESQPIGSAEVQSQRKDKPPKQRPNYFVAVQISNPQIHQSLQDVHNHILNQEPRLKRSLTKLPSLHITLMVMYIGDVETHARAMKSLQNVHLEHDKDMSENPLLLQFEGLDHFQNRVLYAKLTKDAAYERLCSLGQSVKHNFAEASIFSTDSKDRFTPHLTVAKIDFKDKPRGIKKIYPVLYKEFLNQYFGSQRVESIQLLSMTDPKNDAGYYPGEEIYFSAFNPSNRMNSLKKLLAVEDQKKEIKERINRLVKENLT